MVLSKCGMRCDLCLVYRPNVEKEDRREEIVTVFKKVFSEFDADPKTISDRFAPAQEALHRRATLFRIHRVLPPSASTAMSCQLDAARIQPLREMS